MIHSISSSVKRFRLLVLPKVVRVVILSLFLFNGFYYNAHQYVVNKPEVNHVVENKNEESSSEELDIRIIDYFTNRTYPDFLPTQPSTAERDTGERAPARSVVSQALEERPKDKASYYFNNKIPKEDATYKTGAFADCRADMVKTSIQTGKSKFTPISNHKDASKVIISCKEVNFRAPLTRIRKGGSKIVTGVLSAAVGNGPTRRSTVRSTWAKDRDDVYFIVSGDWAAIEAEYTLYNDLIWIDEDEVYFEDGYSVLPFKTEVFAHVVNKYAPMGETGFEYLFKTDDDSYVDIQKLEDELVGNKEDIHYWGCCTKQHYRPLRHPSREFRITFEAYPEQWYPLYCQGAGFAMSRKMTQCITHDDNMPMIRYNPFEDVMVGLLAERCGYPITSDCKKVEQYRSNDSSELKILKDLEIGGELPNATMKGKIVQHRVKTHKDMYAHHLCILEGC